ncbi:ATP-binding protein [Hydrogenobacter sp. T-2]|uniref:sensor histidine kinase n=1 Tax=Pampinifervens diazotrophicum TaxID=1632018 RepID=UPI002B256EFB|nr:ATP-binding protein [Hydrogenobacter sp. T-2]WPM31413.1 ATP-binding protein [Hydrogenobacter sp. T-2]
MSLLKEFLSQVGEGYLLIDKEGRVVFGNDFLLKRRLLRENFEGKPYYECVNNLTVVSCLAEAFSEKKDKVCNFDHEEREYTLYAFTGSELTVVRFSDITELRRYERSRREFVANVSHELKTPIAVLKSLLETLYEEEDREEKKVFLEKALKRVEDMRRLVEDLLILTKLESGEERIKREDVDLRLLVEEVFDLLEPQAKERNISLINSVDRELKVKGDWDKLFLLLKNLVDNAIKYNREGGKVEVKAKRENQYVQLQVQDTGIGIPKEHIPFIFERFYRVDPSRSRNLGGTGLGLSIVKHIALSHGGKIEVQSKEGVGSIFSVFLPLE